MQSPGYVSSIIAVTDNHGIPCGHYESIGGNLAVDAIWSKHLDEAAVHGRAAVIVGSVMATKVPAQSQSAIRPVSFDPRRATGIKPPLANAGTRMPPSPDQRAVESDASIRWVGASCRGNVGQEESRSARDCICLQLLAFPPREANHR